MNQFSLPRRDFLYGLGSSVGSLALTSLLQAEEAGLKPRKGHLPARAKRCIFLMMEGGPSHIDTFDPKPELAKRHLQVFNRQGERESAMSSGKRYFVQSPFEFVKAGQSGADITTEWRHLREMVDDMCFFRGAQVESVNHPTACYHVNTGNRFGGDPALGSWVTYGLGSPNQNLPGFITVNPPAGNGGARNYASGFLPAICQGTRIGGIQIPPLYAALLGKDREPGPPIRNISNRELSQVQQREQLDLIRSLNRRKLQRDIHHPEIEGAIESFELAFRMQDKVPQLLDIGSETRSTMNAYGLGAGLPTDRFARQCLLARRLAEAGVRFIEITAPSKWDHHFLIKTELAKSGSETDQPVAALLTDLRQRGMLQDTLVVWAGEFGRTPYAQSGSGRDHNNHGYTLWMAGGGVKGGMSYGATDEHGHKAVENPVHIQDWHATLLHLLGLDHERLTFNYAGREFRLTDVHGQVVRDILI